MECDCDGFLFVDGVAQESHTVLCPAYKEIPMEARSNPKSRSHESAVEEWEGLTADSEGVAIPVLDYNRAAVQLSGNPSGARIALLGRLEATHDFAPLNDGDGFPVSGLKVGKITDIPHLMVAEVKPIVYGGNEDTKLVLTIVMKR